MMWDWSIFFAFLLPFVAAVAVYFAHAYFTQILPRRAVRKQMLNALQMWRRGEVVGGQVWQHRTGREYLVIAITNGYCDDLDKWPLTVVYCDLKFSTHYSRPLHEFLQTMTLDRTIDNTLPSPFDELMAMTTHKISVGKNTGMPTIGSVWYSVENSGPDNKSINEITVKEIANIDRSQPIVVYIENKYPHDLRAMNLYQFLRMYKRQQETVA